MTRKYPGLYLYFDWLKGLVKLPPEVAMKIIENLYHYAEDGVEPPSLEEMHYSIIQDMYVDQMKRSMIYAQSGRMGGFAKAAKASKQQEEAYDAADFDLDDIDYGMMRSVLQERYGANSPRS